MIILKNHYLILISILLINNVSIKVFGVFV